MVITSGWILFVESVRPSVGLSPKMAQFTTAEAQNVAVWFHCSPAAFWRSKSQRL